MGEVCVFAIKLVETDLNQISCRSVILFASMELYIYFVVVDGFACSFQIMLPFWISYECPGLVLDDQ